VSIGWTASLFEPLGATSQTFALTMTMKHPSLPRVSLYLFTVDPRVLQGSAPAKTATVIGEAAAEQAKLVATAQEQLDALQKRVSNLSNGSSSAAGVWTTAATAGSAGSDPVRTTSAPRPSRGLASVDDAPARAGLSTRGRHTLRASLDALNHSVKSLVKVHAELSHKAAALFALAIRVRKDAAAFTAELRETATQLDGPVQSALLEVQQLGQLQTDLGSFSPDAKSSPAYATLASDLQTAQSTADQLQSSLQALQQRVLAATAGLASLQSDLAQLETKADQSGSAAAQAADSRLRRDVTHARSSVVADVASMDAQLSSAEAKYLSAKAAVAKAIAARKVAVSKAVRREKAAAIRKEAKLEDEAAARVAAAETAASNAEASARSAAAKSAQQVEQSVQASLAESQTELTKIDGQVNSALAEANQSYARILALNQLALLNQLPGGDATDVTTQNGRFAYSIG
jgi:hypothetical protein